VPYFSKYRGSLIKFVSSWIWAGGRDQHRYVFLKLFSKKRYVRKFWLLVWFVFDRQLNFEFWKTCILFTKIDTYWNTQKIHVRIPLHLSFLLIFITPYPRCTCKQQKSPLINNVKETHEILIELSCYCLYCFKQPKCQGRCFFNDVFKSTIYKRRTPRPARQL